MSHIDARDVHVTTGLLLAARRTYVDVPNLRLTIPQAARLWHVTVEVSEAILRRLAAERFLIETHGQFVRARQQGTTEPALRAGTR